MRESYTRLKTNARAHGRAALLSLCAALLAFAAAFVGSSRAALTSARAVDDNNAVALDLPASGDVRIENERGGVAVEVWAEDYISVAYTLEGAIDDGEQSSPVRVERADNILSISVPRTTAVSTTNERAPRARPSVPRGASTRRNVASRRVATANAARAVKLIVRAPARARVSVVTGDGAVEVRGTPARLDVQTAAGDVRLIVAPGADADVMARTLYGAINVGASFGAGEGRTLRERFAARLGAGSRIVRLSTVRGRVALEGSAEIADVRDSRAMPTTDAPTPAAPAPVAASPAARPSDSPVLRPSDSRASRAAVQSPAGQPADSEQSTGDHARPPALVGAPATSSAAERRPPTLVGSDAGRAAQSPQSKPTPPPGTPIEVDEGDVLTVDTSVVTLNFSVVDRQNGRALANLIGGDFKVSEDGVDQQITHFEQSSAPFDLVLLLDLSGSTARVTDLIRGSARRFVDSVRASDRVGVIAFASAPRVVSPLTADKALLRSRLDSLGAPQGDTKLYDAINYSLDYLATNSPKARRRAVVLLTDGMDSSLPNVQGDGSSLPYAELRRRVQEFDGLFYAVMTDNYEEPWSPLDVQPETYDMAWDRMEELTKEAGGLYYEAEELEDVAGIYAQVVQDLGTVYSISYVPTNKARDGTWRVVKVRLPRRPEAVARGRSGYYAK